MATNRSVSASGTGSNQAYGVDGAFSFFQNVTHRRVLGAHGDDGRDRRRPELSGPLRLQRRSLRRARRVSVGRQELQPGGRLHAPHRLQAIVRRAALQPAADAHHERAEVHVDGIGRVRRRTAPGAVDSRIVDRALRHRVREQRSVLDRRHARLRAAASQPFTPAGSPVAIAPRRLHVQRRGGRVRVRRAAARVGHDRGAGRATTTTARSEA